jgi:hypothetical protein
VIFDIHGYSLLLNRGIISRPERLQRLVVHLDLCHILSHGKEVLINAELLEDSQKYRSHSHGRPYCVMGKNGRVTVNRWQRAVGECLFMLLMGGL